MEEQRRALYLEYLRVAQELNLPMTLTVEGKHYTFDEITLEVAQGTQIAEIMGSVIEMHAAHYGTTIEDAIAAHPPTIQ